MDRLLDPSFDPYAWLQSSLSVAGLLDQVPALLRSVNGPLIALLAVGLALMWFGRGGGKRGASSKKADVQLPAQGRGLFGGLLAHHEKRVTIGRVRFDVAWRHIGILATTGARKSTLLALLLEAIGKPYVAIAGDHAPPLLNLTRSLGYRVWTPRGDIAWYPWGGPLELAVQRVEHMFPASGGDVGVHRAMFKKAARTAWAKVDARGRTIEQVIAVLPDTVSGTSGKTMAENWKARLEELLASLGGSLRSGLDGGVDLVELLQDGESMMFALNSFADVSNRERFAKIAVLEALRAADTVGNLSVAMDEVGLMGADLFAESVRTLRVRLCTGLFASHIVKDFPEVLRGVINVWFLGQIPGSDKASREWASQTTFQRVPPEHFGEHALPLGTFWLSANGRVQRLRVPTWRTRKEWICSETPDADVFGATDQPPSSESLGGREQTETTVQSERAVLVEVPEWAVGDPQLLNIWGHVEVKGTHRLSRYHLNNRGRPMCSYDGEDWLPYALVLAKAEGRDLREVRMRMRDRSVNGLTCDHLCRELDPTCPIEDERRCQELSHLRWRTRGGNTSIQWTRKRRRLEAVG